MMTMSDMSLGLRLKVLMRGEKALAGIPDGIMPPARTTVYDPLQLSTVFRGVQVLQTAITGLPLYEVRNGLKLDTVSAIIAQPDVNRSRRDFVSDLVASMVLDGNAFIRVTRFNGDPVTCEVLPPTLVTVNDDGNDPAAPMLRYSYLGRDYSAEQIIHCKFLNVPGRLRGLGPISAAREEVEGAQMARDYKAHYYKDSSNTKGYLKAKKKLTPASAKETKDGWNNKGGKAGDIKLLGEDIEYVPLDMKPADLQFLETQKFDTTQIARLLGIPASIMLAAIDGSNLTYSNIEQSWIEFADYTLAAYTGEIEEALTSLLPRGRSVKFDWDTAHRTGMSERYAAYATGIKIGMITPDEPRGWEGMPPLTDAQRKQISQSQPKEAINGNS